MAEGLQNQTIGLIAAPKSPARARILLVDDDELLRQSVARTLQQAGHEVVALADPTSALHQLAAACVDMLLTPIRTPFMTGLELLSEVKAVQPDLPVILMTPYAHIRSAVEAMRRGAYDYIQKPFEKDHLLLLVDRTLEHARLKREQAAVLHADMGISQQRAPTLIGSSPVLQRLRQAVERGGRCDAHVLVRGEPGSGRKLAARLIHNASERRGRPMLSVRSAALSDAAVAEALFGGSNPPAPRSRLELAAGGTLLLEELSSLPPGLQEKLSALLASAVRLHVRIIATSVGTTVEGAPGGLLDAAVIDVPPLRDRREDVPELVRHFLHRIARRHAEPFRHIEPSALRLLQRYDWPGNVLELQNILERAVMVEPEPGVVRTSTLSPWLGERPHGRLGGDPLDQLPLAEVEKRVILDTLAKFEGHRARTATALGIGVRTLGIKLKKWREDGDLPDTDQRSRSTALAETHLAI